MGSLMHKRCLKRILEEANVQDQKCVDNTVVSDKILKRSRCDRAGEAFNGAPCPQVTEAIDCVNPRVSFSKEPPRVTLIDGLGSDIIKRQRREIWYTRDDYRVFWRDRIDSVKMWQMVYGGGAGDGENDLEMLLDEQFTVRGLENYTTDQSEAKALDPKKNSYIQTVLREQKQNVTVEPTVIRELTSKVTQRSLERAQMIAKRDEHDAQQPCERTARSFSIGASRKSESPPISPASITAFGAVQQAEKRDLRKRVLNHMNEREHEALFRQRRCSMQMYEQRQRLSSQQQQAYQQHRMVQRRPSVHHPPSPAPAHFGYQPQEQSYTLPNSQYHHQSSNRPPFGMRGHRDSIGMYYNSVPLRQQGPTAMDMNPNRAMVTQGAATEEQPPRCLTFSPRCRSYSQPQRRSSMQGGVNTPYAYPNQERMSDPAYNDMIAEYSGMRRDSLAGHYV